MKALKTIAAVTLAAALGVATWCCGPKVAPVAVGEACPGGLAEVCEPGDGEKIGPHNCYCPEE